MKKILLLEVPPTFFKSEPFYLEPDELRVFLEGMKGYVEGKEVHLQQIDIESTIQNHSGDARVWFRSEESGGLVYEVFHPTYVFMQCEHDDYYDDVFEWIRDYVPSLFYKFFPYNEEK